MNELLSVLIGSAGGGTVVGALVIALIQRNLEETFGATGAWLRGGSQMRKEGRYWTQVVTYTNSKQIDTDIYKNA